MQSGIAMKKNWVLSVEQWSAGIAAFCACHRFADGEVLRWNGFSGIQKAVVDQIDSRTSNSDHDIFWCKFGFGKWFETSQSSHWAGHCWLSYKVHFLSNITIWLRNCSLLLHIIREDYNTKLWFKKKFSVSSRAPTYQTFSPFQFASCWMIIEWSILSSSATSCEVVRGSASVIF